MKNLKTVEIVKFLISFGSFGMLKEIKSITLVFPVMNCVGLRVHVYVSVDFIFFPEASSFCL